MPVTLEMTTNNRLLVMRYIDPLTFPELQDATLLAYREYLDCATFPVHGINDFSGVRRLSPAFIAQGVEMLRHPHPQRGQILLVMDTLLLNSISGLLNSLSEWEIRTFPTYDNAHAYALYLLHTEANRHKNT
jgi:hypothetical protein